MLEERHDDDNHGEKDSSRWRRAQQGAQQGAAGGEPNKERHQSSRSLAPRWRQRLADAPKHRRQASPSIQDSSKAAAGAQAAVGAAASPAGTGYLGMLPTPISEWSEPESLQRFLREPPSPAGAAAPQPNSGYLVMPPTPRSESSLSPPPPHLPRRAAWRRAPSPPRATVARPPLHGTVALECFSEGGDAGGGSQSSNRATPTPHSSHQQLRHRHRRRYRANPQLPSPMPPGRYRANPQLRAGPPAVGGDGSEGKGKPGKGQSKEEETPKERKSERFRRSPPRQFPRVFHARGNPWHGAWGALFGGRIEGWQHFPGPAPSPGHPFWSHKGWPSCSCGQ